VHGQVVIDADRLAGIADQFANASRLTLGVEAGDPGQSRDLAQQRDQDSRRGGLAGAVRPRKPKISPRSTAKESPARAVLPHG
jgi:hypothetical protein